MNYVYIRWVEKLIAGIERERLQVKSHIKEPYDKVKKFLQFKTEK